MGPIPRADRVAAFTEELPRRGSMLSGRAVDLAYAIPPEAYPAEEPGEVVIEAVIETIRTAGSGAPPGDLQQATSVIAAARVRVRDHLQLALELSRRVHDTGRDGPRRGIG